MWAACKQNSVQGQQKRQQPVELLVLCPTQLYCLSCHCSTTHALFPLGSTVCPVILQLLMLWSCLVLLFVLSFFNLSCFVLTWFYCLSCHSSTCHALFPLGFTVCPVTVQLLMLCSHLVLLFVLSLFNLSCFVPTWFYCLSCHCSTCHALFPLGFTVCPVIVQLLMLCSHLVLLFVLSLFNLSCFVPAWFYCLSCHCSTSNALFLHGFTVCPVIVRLLMLCSCMVLLFVLSLFNLSCFVPAWFYCLSCHSSTCYALFPLGFTVCPVIVQLLMLCSHLVLLFVLSLFNLSCFVPA